MRGINGLLKLLLLSTIFILVNTAINAAAGQNPQQIWRLIDTKIEEAPDPYDFMVNRDNWLQFKGQDGNLTITNNEIYRDKRNFRSTYTYTWELPPQVLIPEQDIRMPLSVLRQDFQTSYGWSGGISAQFTNLDSNWGTGGQGLGGISVGGKDPAGKNSAETTKVPKLGWSRTGNTGKMVLMVTIRHPHYRRTYRYVYQAENAQNPVTVATSPQVTSPRENHWRLIDTKVEEAPDPYDFMVNRDNWLQFKGQDGNLTITNNEIYRDKRNFRSTYTYAWELPPQVLIPEQDIRMPLSVLRQDFQTSYGWSGGISAQFTNLDSNWGTGGQGLGGISVGGKDPAGKNSAETTKVPKLGWSRTRDTGKMVLMVTIRHPHYRRTYRYVYEYMTGQENTSEVTSPSYSSLKTFPDIKDSASPGSVSGTKEFSHYSPEEVLKAFFNKTTRLELDGYRELFCVPVGDDQLRALAEKRESTIASGGTNRSATEQFFLGIRTDFSSTRFERLTNESSRVRIKILGYSTIIFPDSDTRIHKYDETDQYTLIKNDGSWQICPSR